jgi:hypothetical protein
VADITGLTAAAVGVPAGTDDGATVEKLVEVNPWGSRLELLIVDRGVEAGLATSTCGPPPCAMG